jgi:hypothetical protein
MRLCVKKHMHIDTKQYNRTIRTLANARVPVLLAGTQGPRSLAVTGLAGQLDRIGHSTDADWTETGRAGLFFGQGYPDGGIGPPTHRRNHLRNFCHFSQDPPGCPWKPLNRRDPPRTPTNPHTALPEAPSPLSRPHTDRSGRPSHPAATATAATSRKQRRAAVLA